MKQKEELHHPAHKIKRTLDQRASDALSSFIGSWKFLIIIIIFLTFWITESMLVLFFQEVWDPYPYIFLNLVLAIITGLTAPIILMSQNRQEQKDRVRSEYDYAVNKKAEKEIRDIKEQLARIEKKLR